MLDEVEEVARSECHHAVAFSGLRLVHAADRVVHMDKRVHDHMAILEWHGQQLTDGLERDRRYVVADHRNVDHASQLVAHLVQGRVRPVAEPVQHTSVEQGWRGGRSLAEVVARRVHREHDVQISNYLKQMEKFNKNAINNFRLGWNYSGVLEFPFLHGFSRITTI